MESAIRATLAEIEEREDVRVVYACESGSRAWGFASTDSDWDVRFIYVRPRDWYLSIALERRSDVIELPIVSELDVAGWDLRKTLTLLRKSNPPLLEWLRSPIVYREEGPVAGELRRLAKEYWSDLACLHHYLNMARGNFREHLRGETVWTKKYFYVLRPLLAVRWIEKDLGAVPMEFDRLVEHTVEDESLREAIAELLVQKRQGDELRRGPRVPVISDFIEAELDRLANVAAGRKRVTPPVEPFDAVFRSAL